MVLAVCADTTGEANIGNDQTVAIRQRAALEPLFYAGGSQNHVDAVFYGEPPAPSCLLCRHRTDYSRVVVFYPSCITPSAFSIPHTHSFA